MAYIDVFRKRSSSLNSSDSANNYMSDELLRALNIQLASSPNSVTAIIDEVEHKVIMTSRSSTVNKDVKKVSALNDAGLSTGVAFTALGEEWLIISTDTKVFGDYFSGLAVRVNYQLKWLDIYGNIHSDYSFITGSMYSFVQDAFASSPIFIEKTTNEIVAIMPQTTLTKHEKLIFAGKVWKIVNIDSESVNGISFVSLEETLANLELDNIELKLADYYELRNWTIEFQNNDDIELLVGETITVVPVIKLNDQLQEETCEILLATSAIISFSGLEITGDALGTQEITVGLVNNNTISQALSINVVASKTSSSTIYVEGNNKVEPLRTYSLVGYEAIDGVASEVDGTFTVQSDVDSIIDTLTTTSTNSSTVLIAEDAAIGSVATINFHSGIEDVLFTITVKSFWT